MHAEVFRFHPIVIHKLLNGFRIEGKVNNMINFAFPEINLILKWRYGWKCLVFFFFFPYMLYKKAALVLKGSLGVYVLGLSFLMNLGRLFKNFCYWIFFKKKYTFHLFKYHFAHQKDFFLYILFISYAYH